MSDMKRQESATTGLGLWLQRQLCEGAVMIDVGANVGDYTALAARAVGPHGHVYACEPAPANVALLHERFDAVPQVSVVPAAVGDHSGTTTFFLDRRASTRHSCAAANVGKTGATITVPQVMLDDVCGGLSRLDVVKVDAQGAEMSILHGARMLLKRFRPAMVLELWPHGLSMAGANAASLLTFLKDRDYAVFRLSAKGPLKPERFVDEFLRRPMQRWSSINIVAVRREPVSTGIRSLLRGFRMNVTAPERR